MTSVTKSWINCDLFGDTLFECSIDVLIVKCGLVLPDLYWTNPLYWKKPNRLKTIPVRGLWHWLARRSFSIKTLSRYCQSQTFLFEKSLEQSKVCGYIRSSSVCSQWLLSEFAEAMNFNLEEVMEQDSKEILTSTVAVELGVYSCNHFLLNRWECRCFAQAWKSRFPCIGQNVHHIFFQEDRLTLLSVIE